MKNCLLIIVALLFSLNVNAQEKINTNDLIGYWEPNRHSSQLVFWKDVKGNLQVIEFSTGNGAAFDSKIVKLDKTLVIDTYFEEMNYHSTSEYSFIDKDTLKCTVTGEIEATVIYTRIK